MNLAEARYVSKSNLSQHCEQCEHFEYRNQVGVCKQNLTPQVVDPEGYCDCFAESSALDDMVKAFVSPESITKYCSMTDDQLIALATTDIKAATEYAERCRKFNVPKAIEYYEKAGDLGNPHSYGVAGLLAESLEKYKLAAKLYQKGVPLGCYMQAYWLGNLYYSNKVGNIFNRDSKAIYYYRIAAENAQPDAQAKLAVLLFEADKCHYAAYQNTALCDGYEFWLECAMLNNDEGAWNVFKRIRSAMYNSNSGDFFDSHFLDAKSIILRDYRHYLTKK